MRRAKALAAIALVAALGPAAPAPSVAARGTGRVGTLRTHVVDGGRAVAGIGDLDGDSIPDLAVGDPEHDSVTILFMAAGGSLAATQLVGSAMGGFTGTVANDDFGESIGLVGDVDGDGVQDLAVGAPRDDDLWDDAGAIWILFMEPDGTVKGQQKVSSLAGGLPWLPLYARFGQSVTGIGDVDGDGTPDVAVGAPYYPTTTTRNGSVFVLFLRPDGTVKATTIINDLSGGFVGPLADYDLFGMSVAGLGDFDGDGTPDLVVGVEHDRDGGDFTGALWVLTLTPTGTVKSQQKISARAGGLAAPIDRGHHFGTDVAVPGDIDDDGIADLVTVQYSYENGLDGAIWVLFLRADGTVKSHQRIDEVYGGLPVPPGARFGHGVSVGSPGDLDGDGLVDVAVSLPGDGATLWLLLGDGLAKPPCEPTPIATCTAAAKASLDLKAHVADDAKDRLKLKWQGTGAPDLGDPTSTTTYALCLYDTTVSTPVHVASVRIVPGSAWRSVAPTKFLYRDRDATSDGVRTAKIDVAASGMVRASVVARGLRLPMPVGRGDAGFFALDPGVVAQLVNDAGACWTADFSLAKTSSVAQFRARLP